MNNLRIVDYWKEETPSLPIKGIFHKWINKDNKTIALVEEFYGGRVYLVEIRNMNFLNYWQTRDFWIEIKNNS